MEVFFRISPILVGWGVDPDALSKVVPLGEPIPKFVRNGQRQCILLTIRLPTPVVRIETGWVIHDNMLVFVDAYISTP